METLTKFFSTYIIIPIPGYRKLNNHLLNPIAAGISGFTIFFITIYFMHLLLFIIGLNEKLGMEYSDYLLAGFGFSLQMTGTLIKSFDKRKTISFMD